jgi:phospholipase/carboxylesterase
VTPMRRPHGRPAPGLPPLAAGAVWSAPMHLQTTKGIGKGTWGPSALWCAGLLAASCRGNARPGLHAAPAAPAAPAFGGLQVEIMGGGPETQPGGRVVVLLHGWGAPGTDLVPLGRLYAGPRTRVVIPAAPLPHPFGGRAWWDLDLERLQRRDHALMSDIPDGLPAARARVQGLLADLRARYRPDALILGGFSQGGMLAMDVALAANPAVDRVAVLSGALIAEPLWRKEMERGPALPVLLTHGRHDGVLPFAASEALKALLDAHHFPVTWLPFDGDHEIPAPVIAALGDFINR